MRVALVHDWLTGMRGGEKCLEALCRVWPNAHLYTLLHQRGRVSPIIEDRPVHTSFLQRIPGIFEHYRWTLPLMPAAVRGLKLRRRYDAVISLSHAVAKAVEVPAETPHICYCFTPMRWAWHCYEDYFGEAARRQESEMAGRQGGETSRGQSGQAVRGQAVRSLIQHPTVWLPRHLAASLPRRLAASFLERYMAGLRRWDRATSEGVTHFVAISHTVADRIRECYGRYSTVIFPPADTEFYAPAPVHREEFYLCVSALVPYKRIDLAIQACRGLGRPLVVVGKGPEAARLRQMAGPDVQFLGWQPDEVVRDHLRRCRALIFPGKEDFGIVPVEAGACGTPIIAYGQGGATETVIPPTVQGPGTGLFFPLQSTESLMSAIEWLELHPAHFSPELARVQAEQFATRRFCDEMGAYVDAVCRQHALLRSRKQEAPSTEQQSEQSRRPEPDRRFTHLEGYVLDDPHPLAGPHGKVAHEHGVPSKGGDRRHSRRAGGRSAAPWLLLAIVLGGLAGAVPHARAAVFHRKINLNEVNRSLAGRVLDFTQNHGGDYRICSDAQHQRRDLYVYLPPHYSRKNRYPLVVWLHGYGGDERQFIRQAVHALDEAIVQGDLPPVIAACPDGSLRGNFRMWGHGSWFTNSRHGRFEDYIIQDVMGFLLEHFPVDPDPRLHVAIGWSMGGFAAYKFGVRYPETFRVLVGIYPNLNMRWCDRDGRYRTDFDPKTAGTLETLPRWQLIGVVPEINFPVTFDWAINRIWGDGEEAIRRLSKENPIEMVDRQEVQPGEFDLLIAYGRQDEYNVDAQVESFLYHARQHGLNVWVRYHPQGHHTSEWVTECLPDVWREVGVRLRRNRTGAQWARGSTRGIAPARNAAAAPKRATTEHQGSSWQRRTTLR